MKKYELIADQTKIIGDVTLYRIRALVDFFGIQEGELGGFIEKEANLSHEGKCWVFGDACVYDNARLYGNAEISDNAQLFGNAQMYDDAYMSDNAQMFDNAKLFGEACLSDDARLCGDAWVSGSVHVSERACVSGKAYIPDDMQIFADAHITGNDDYLIVFPLNSVGSRLTAIKQKDGSIYITISNFTGTFEEFMDYLDALPDDKYSTMLYGIAGIVATKLGNE